ncbi:hypothetical protein [Actinorugispora endophytica]|uniref:Uncharacterized protein n=1 Tax=Actinorugispora endophytica TaxID=1605990 RepID=A0A4R6V8C9_9ACTN|nr:hypothetical protein [Actinorugispora endophytica]TDQ55008.1 hypothetical protein EV190_101329 [Actinorugispora endophytica]
MNLLLFGYTKVQSYLPFNTDVGTYGWGDEVQVPSGALASVNTLFSWGRGVIVIIGIIGVLFCAGKMAVGKFGRSDLAAEGVGGLVWTVLGISLMLIAVPVITLLLPGAVADV